jgi:hypothetical protein
MKNKTFDDSGGIESKTKKEQFVLWERMRVGGSGRGEV